MKVILSKQYKKKKEKRKLKRYWSVLYPKEYVGLMLSKQLDVQLTKVAKSKLKEESLFGTLRQKDTGFVYVDVSNKVIHGLFSLINEDGAKEPPYFGKGEIGAHISAISDDELEEDIKIEELGEEISFTVNGVYSTKPEGWDEMDRVWFLSVDCNRIKEIRKKYKLPATYKDKGHDYHITFAVKEK
jgi:hypothetical protein